MLLKVSLLLAAAALHDVTAANILALVTLPSPSHHIWNRVWVRALAERGHRVTTLSADRESNPHPNHRQLIIEGAYDYHDGGDEGLWDFQKMSEDGPLTSLSNLHMWGLQMCEQAFRTDGLKTLMTLRNETFDLIIVEVAAGECYLGFVPYFGSPPVLAVTAFSSPTWSSYLLGSSDPPSIVPGIMTSYSDKMNFCQRLSNTVVYYGMHFMRIFSYLPRMDAIVRANFKEPMPSVIDLERNMSMILVNTDVSVDYPRAVVPAMVPVGGLHIQPSHPLPQDLQKFMDESPQGVIYFSLGSNLRSDQLGEEKVSALVEAFRVLPQRVLWKWESAALPGQPENVRVGKWMPQSDILAHPNLRLFITHGGLLSLQEAVARAVPVIGIPFFADQHTNIEKAIQHEVGEKVVFTTLTTQSFVDVIKKVIHNPKYRDNMKKLSQIFHDQPQSPLDRAVFWMEYVIRHKGAPHLRCSGSDLTWYQFYLLDVVAVVLLGALVALAVVYLTLRTLVRLVTGSKGQKHKQQ